MTGWADTWMMSSKAQAPQLHAKWMAWMLTPEVQSAGRRVLRRGARQPQGVPVPRRRVRLVRVPGFCDLFGVNDPTFYNSIAFWKTPLADCGDDRGQTCIDYDVWTQKWTEIKG